MNEKFQKRLFSYSVNILKLCNNPSNFRVSHILLNQLFRSATSIHANYCEANGAASIRDFRHKIALCRKEAMETKYWLRLLREVDTNKEIYALLSETHEFVLIFSKILSTTDKRINRE